MLPHLTPPRLILAAALVALPISGAAQQPAAPPPATCTGASHHAFDFWIGEWNVMLASGQQAGTNRITAVAGHCALLEEWQATNGPAGVSLNWYEPATGQWYQTWVSPGVVLRLQGGLVDGQMVLAGTRQLADGSELRDRITWAPLPGGSVRQAWESSRDGGTTWQVVFLGTYQRRR